MNTFDYLFENTSQLEKPFLVGTECVTYKELYHSSLIQADYIRNQIGENNKILLISVNNRFFIQSYLSIIKSGNICIPLDPSIEKANFIFIAQETNPSLIFLTKDIQKKLPVDQYTCIYPDTLPEKTNEVLLESKFNVTSEDQCVEIIFTSGSSGKPKGVMLSHKNLISNTNSILSYLHLDTNDRMLVVLPFYYCYGLSLLHTHLRVGGSLVLNNSFIFIGKVIQDLTEHRCTGFAGVPSHFQVLIRKSELFKKTAFPNLRYVTQAGGGLATIIIDEFREYFPGIAFYVMYGQTEATARLSYLHPDIYPLKKGSIGKGIPGVELIVLNEKGKKINPGQTGEIAARGDNIMIGYFSDPSSSNQTIKDGWLHTGDMGTIDSDGYIYLTARKKEIIKVNGKRISPREIRDILLMLPQVIECSIESEVDDKLGEIITATIISSKDTDDAFNEQSVKRFCHIHLAAFKVPQKIEFKKSVLLSATGKKTF